MSLLIRMHPDEYSALAVWEIGESEKHLLSRLELGEVDRLRLEGIKHPHKRLEFLSARAALLELGVSLGDLSYTPEGKPVVDGAFLSITHNHQFAAALIHTEAEVGIDVEDVRRNFEGLVDRYLREDERFIVEDMPELGPMMLWGAKECGYKMHGRRRLDFKEHLRLLNKGDEWFVEVLKSGEESVGKIERLRHGDAYVIWAVEQPRPSPNGSNEESLTIQPKV